jgi:hypothetical protein
MKEDFVTEYQQLEFRNLHDRRSSKASMKYLVGVPSR